jgi:hypothetical protein
MAHPKRKREAEALYKQLIQYPFSDVYIIWDELNNEWHTGERALKGGIVLGSDWHLVIQDDAVLTPHIYDNIEGLISALPVKSVVSLYTGKVRPLQDRVIPAVQKAPNGSFLSHYMMMWGVAILLPSDQIEAMLEFAADPMFREDKYDIRVGRFYYGNHLPIYYSMPSLVDHDDSIGSLIGNGGTTAPRVAHRLATGRVSWTDRVIAL